MATPKLIAAVDTAIEIYEDLVGEYASRTRQMLDLHGHLEALSRLVQNPDLQSGFKALRDAGQLAVSFEAIVVEFAGEFDPQIVSAAQWRLDNADALL
jgi:hypothetical protein